MTTIAFKAGVIAADTLATWGNSRDGEFTKIARRGPFLAGVSGAVAPCQRFLDWFVSGMEGDPPPMPEGDALAHGIIITPADECLTWGPRGWERTRVETYALGSGADYATGAMAMGATAEEAVRVAMRFDTKTGGEVLSLRR